jgi:hypothetical protein
MGGVQLPAACVQDFRVLPLEKDVFSGQSILQLFYAIFPEMADYAYHITTY